jgi:hypothetical protein
VEINAVPPALLLVLWIACGLVDAPLLDHLTWNKRLKETYSSPSWAVELSWAVLLSSLLPLRPPTFRRSVLLLIDIDLREVYLLPSPLKAAIQHITSIHPSKLPSYQAPSPQPNPNLQTANPPNSTLHLSIPIVFHDIIHSTHTARPNLNPQILLLHRPKTNL